VGALVTLELDDDSPLADLPWIITIGPLDDEEEWEPVVCGPYERAHALAIAEAVVADEELMAVVEPLKPHVEIDAIRSDVIAARLAAQDDEDDDGDSGAFADELESAFGDPDLLVHAEHEAEHQHDHDHDHRHNGYQPTVPPTSDEVRAGMARIADRLTKD
jgi:ABC-type Zn2+ transport system substrate-binding protein/surface adhesin